ncbi:hypothetical protein GF357_00405 [Candidatus Dojkabacteria bacterium]|nr:hypothetical protein [Candidatus Dojkabacteria bacterium]
MKPTNSTVKAKFYGIGGQGIKFLATTLGNVLHHIGYDFITINSDYDTIVRGGKIEACTTASSKSINSPIVEKADFCVILSDPGSPIPSATYIIDSSLNNIVTKDDLPNSSKTFYEPFLHNENALPPNMLVLGFILNKMGHKIDEEHLVELLPEKNREDNIQAILHHSTPKGD